MIYLSLGENCLPDDILKRHGIKAFSTPYSPCRSNIDYALILEKTGYRDLLNPDRLTVENSWGKPVVRSREGFSCSKIYYAAHMNGFEFTHHDPLNSLKNKESFQRKIDRLNNIRKTEDICFFYFHRKNKESNIGKIRNGLLEFLEFYKNDSNKVRACLFWQEQISDLNDRGLVASSSSVGIFEFCFKTENIWEGNDPEIFWGRVDEDLILKMINEVRSFED